MLIRMIPVLSQSVTKVLHFRRRLFSRCCINIITSTFSKASFSKLASHIGEKNLLIIGPPGAGKTTAGRIIGQKLGLPFIDVDDDVLEKTWDMPVSQKLSEVGGERFLEEEGKVLLNFSSFGCVISMSGSNPLHPVSMQHMKRNGIVVYLDVDNEDIMRRMEKMKVDRIVGQTSDCSIRDILRYRQQFYRQWFDLRVLCGTGDTAEDVCEKILKELRRYFECETFVSTRSAPSEIPQTYFCDVTVEGLAPDGGLYVPSKDHPRLSAGEWQRLIGMSFPERAQVLLEKCIHPVDVNPVQLIKMVEKAYGNNFNCSKVAPIRHLVDDQYVQELFHGPTASFKDMALQLMPQIFAYSIPQTCNYLILVATSGDTGSAVLDGFSMLCNADKQRIAVLVLFPENGISPIQKKQITSYRQENVKAVGVNSDFDFCQRAIKHLFSNPAFNGFLATEYGVSLSTANSINWARLLPQIVYHCSAYLDLIDQGVISLGDPIDVCIPTGNFGNFLSAIYVKQMGIPIRKFICASNQNNVLTDFMNTGVFDLRNRKLHISASPAIDILKSSNLERFIHLISKGDWQLVQDLYSQLLNQNHFIVPKPVLESIHENCSAGWCSENDCFATIHSVFTKTGYILDPHTAVAKTVADRLQDGTCPVVISSTAHYAKFAPDVLRSLMVKELSSCPLDQLQQIHSLNPLPVSHKPLMDSLSGAENREHEVCEADIEAVSEKVEEFVHNTFMKQRV
ncbi:threonine synthase-like 1 [Erpetoichthys calabaricus]|uniref:Threonine synthase like 1 n=1 Tax=Erpetoichthys calabaricus TaxID=27687 RepID=A0A8C4S025_ERPCA|nr:threonine synthase-like 1 [Erpetoichthys calabaricus]